MQAFSSVLNHTIVIRIRTKECAENTDFDNFNFIKI